MALRLRCMLSRSVASVARCCTVVEIRRCSFVRSYWAVSRSFVVFIEWRLLMRGVAAFRLCSGAVSRSCWADGGMCERCEHGRAVMAAWVQERGTWAGHNEHGRKFRSCYTDAPIIATMARENQRGGQGGILLPQKSAKAIETRIRVHRFLWKRYVFRTPAWYSELWEKRVMCTVCEHGRKSRKFRSKKEHQQRRHCVPKQGARESQVESRHKKKW